MMWLKEQYYSSELYMASISVHLCVFLYFILVYSDDYKNVLNTAEFNENKNHIQ